jgi:type II secretory ATPase GspE/PulE/Tfp pilus assembly ATPase PilB-like protein
LVLSTLHTNSAAASFARLLEMGASGNLIADAISLIVAQRLVRRTNKDTTGAFGTGRTVISEFLEPDVDFQNLIKNKATIHEFEDLYKQKGYHTLADDLAQKKASGEVGPEETY